MNKNKSDISFTNSWLLTKDDEVVHLLFFRAEDGVNWYGTFSGKPENLSFELDNGGNGLKLRERIIKYEEQGFKRSVKSVPQKLILRANIDLQIYIKLLS